MAHIGTRLFRVFPFPRSETAPFEQRESLGWPLPEGKLLYMTLFTQDSGHVAYRHSLLRLPADGQSADSQ